jgi:putative aldouronate transport system permease protein
VVLPLSKPIIATIALFTVVARWNDFFTGLLYINDIKLIPLQNYLRTLIVNAQFESQNIEESLSIITVSGTGKNISGLMESIKMAAIIVSLGPILLAYPFVQKYFVKGVLVGSVKG